MLVVAGLRLAKTVSGQVVQRRSLLLKCVTVETTIVMVLSMKVVLVELAKPVRVVPMWASVFLGLRYVQAVAGVPTVQAEPDQNKKCAMEKTTTVMVRLMRL